MDETNSSILAHNAAGEPGGWNRSINIPSRFQPKRRIRLRSVPTDSIINPPPVSRADCQRECGTASLTYGCGRNWRPTGSAMVRERRLRQETSDGRSQSVPPPSPARRRYRSAHIKRRPRADPVRPNGRRRDA
ncbi:unnamed protein product [Nesidiocoris tenuis]|uniref:Uncharacterized protein n=1 Tax=Nesidiocoris tenuis TaxID=355587 RepID=A0A6H5HF28_9HEMI|nr:unnamed protein product [Nesidiocoris tenuis]